MDSRDNRCKHGVRWPHPCDDCHEEDMKPENLIARIVALQADNAALREGIEQARKALVRHGPADYRILEAAPILRALLERNKP